MLKTAHSVVKTLFICLVMAVAFRPIMVDTCRDLSPTRNASAFETQNSSADQVQATVPFISRVSVAPLNTSNLKSIAKEKASVVVLTPEFSITSLAQDQAAPTAPSIFRSGLSSRSISILRI